MPRQKAADEAVTFEDVFASAVKFEEQAERYRFGEKAERNMMQAAGAYARAFELDPSSADALYNQARVSQTLATTFMAGPTPALPTLQKSIDQYRQALLLDPTSQDIVYNLALALVDQGELDRSLETSSYTEAKALLEQLIQAQLAALATATEPDDDVDVPLDESMEVQETVTVVPSTVIETLLSYADLLVTMLPLDGSDPSSLLSPMDEALNKATELDAANHYDTQAIQLMQASCALSVLGATYASASAFDMNRLSSVVDSLAKLHEAQPANVEILADYADALTLTASLLYASRSDAYTTSAVQALERFTRLIQALSSPLSAGGTPAHARQLILSSSLTQCAFLSLLLSDPTRAQAYARRAVEATATGIIFEPSAGGFVKRGIPSGARRDWPAERAMHLAALTVLRTAFYAQTDTSAGMELLRKGMVGKGNVPYEQGREFAVGQAEVRSAVAAEFEGDGLWVVSEGKEAAFWTECIARLPL